MRFFLKWFAALAATTILCSLCILYLDVPIARLFLVNYEKFTVIGYVFRSRFLIFLITCMILSLLIMRIIRGHIPQIGETLAVAGLSAISAFLINDFVLKRIFSRQYVLEFFSHPINSGFQLFAGDINSGFPSGHAVLVSAALFVVARVYCRMLPLIVMTLSIIGAVLLFGDWHFLSDILAGMFVGASAGTLVGEHMKARFSKLLEVRNDSPIKFREFLKSPLSDLIHGRMDQVTHSPERLLDS